MKRMFIGLKVEPDYSIFHLYQELQDTLKDPSFHWINPDNLHLTLRFLGNTEENQLTYVIQHLDVLIPQFSNFEIEINGLDVFTSRKLPRILWAGVKMPETAFNLIENIEDIVSDAGFERMVNSYSPHLTLCRIKNLKGTADLNPFLDEYRHTFFKKQEVKEINLYESILKSSGSVYTILHSFPLTNKENS